MLPRDAEQSEWEAERDQALQMLVINSRSHIGIG
jgi:hypothetical protein